jgi:hypothetical protein
MATSCLRIRLQDSRVGIPIVIGSLRHALEDLRKRMLDPSISSSELMHLKDYDA